LAAHPLAQIRQVAVACWAADEDRDPVLAAKFAIDEDKTVRGNLAHSLQKFDGYDTVRVQLGQDRSREIRDLIHASGQESLDDQ